MTAAERFARAAEQVGPFWLFVGALVLLALPVFITLLLREVKRERRYIEKQERIDENARREALLHGERPEGDGPCED